MTENTTPDLGALRRVAEAATPGPWHWRNTQEVYLLGARSRCVMAFERMGMQGAQPTFRKDDGLLYPAGRENLHALPDAKFIANANPTTVLALLDRLEAAEAAVERVEALQRDLANPDVELIGSIERAHRRIVARELRAALAQPATDAACGPNGGRVDAGDAEDAEGAQRGGEGS